MKNLIGKNWKVVKNGGLEYEKSMFLHGIRGKTSDYDLVMHHWSSRKHGIQGSFIIIGHQNFKNLTHCYEKKWEKVKIFKQVGFEVGNMYLTACSLASRY